MREFALLQHVFAANRRLPRNVAIPPGDDMGAVRLARGDEEILVTVDQVADGVHFELATTPIAKIARKAITRNLSDVAAMACRPVAAVAAASLPNKRSLTPVQVRRLFDGLRRTAAEYHCPLIGGDVSMWDGPLLLTVTILAQRWRRDLAPVLRRTARVGDIVYVSGVLGGSLLPGRTPAGKPYIHHLDFTPRLELARRLVQRYRPSAMIDLSDGLARDLGHICELSHVAAVIDAVALPVRPELLAQPTSKPSRRAQAAPAAPAWQHALADGEDYELCFTVPPAIAAKLPKRVGNVPLTRIGRIVAVRGRQRSLVQVRTPQGDTINAHGLGWEHGSRKA